MARSDTHTHLMQYSGVRLLPLARTHTEYYSRAQCQPASQREKNSAILQMYIIVAPDILWTPILAAPLSQMYIVFCTIRLFMYRE